MSDHQALLEITIGKRKSTEAIQANCKHAWRRLYYSESSKYTLCQAALMDRKGLICNICKATTIQD